VQEQFTLSDGSAVRLTIARYYTPLGRSIQKPYTLGADSVYSHNLSDHAGGSDITHTRHEKSTGKAIKLPDGRVLYSEEGIRPDVLVSIDSTRMQLYHHLPDIQQKMTEAALSYTRLHARALVALNQGAELTSLLKNDATVQQWLQPFFDSLPPTMDLNRSKALLLSDFEDMIVWIKWQDQGYYKHTAGKDPEIQKAMETLRN
jgi:carboxyl-terminal processing protease